MKKSDIKRRLTQYGFQQYQIDKLLKNGTLNTIHGVYTFDFKTFELYLEGKLKLY